MGEYIPPPGAFVRDLDDEVAERSPENEGTERTLGDEVTDRNLEFINELRGFQISDLELPQLVVIGDQSSGKSSVLQAITRIPFPINEDMCTRFATEVSLHRSPPGYPTATSLSVKIDPEHVQEYSEEHRRRISEWESHNGHVTDELDPQSFARVLNEASNVILGGHTDRNVLDNVTLCISQTGPDKPNLTIVDLPGLVSVNHEAHATALSLVRKYIDNPKSIILAILQPGDRATQYAHQMLQSIHDKKDRVIGLINKCDRKELGAHKWIFDYLMNRETDPNSEYLTEGWFGLRNRGQLEQGISNRERDQREEEFFKEQEWADLDQPRRLGIYWLRKALTKMLNAHIAKSIPTLIPEIRAKITDCKTELDRLGEARDTRSEQLNCMMTLATEFSKLSVDALNGNYHTLPAGPNAKVRKIYQDALDELQQNMHRDRKTFFISDPGYDIVLSEPESDFNPDNHGYALLRSKRESEWKENILEQGIFREIYNVIRANRGREFPEEVNNPCVLNILWGGKTSSWKRQATWVIDKFVISIARAISIFFETVCPDEDLRENIRSWLSERLHEVSQNARKELDNLITDEAKAIWTVNPQRAKQVVKLRNNRIKAMTEELEDLESQEKDEENSDEEEYQDAETRIKSWLETNGVMAAVFNTHDHLVAYYDVAMDRFIDNVGLQVVERHLLGPSNPLQIFTAQYVVQESEKDETFLERIARERVSKREQREAWNRKKENLKRALQTAEDYGFLGQ